MKKKKKSMGRTLAIHILIPIDLFRFISMCVGASSVPLDLMKHQNQTLVYFEDTTHDVKYFCEFAPRDALQGAFEEICYTRNLNMRMIRDGEEYFPWRKYSKGEKGIILACVDHEMKNSSCSNGFRLYSVCTVSCPPGFVNTAQTIECKLKPPLNNVSAEWSSKNFCQPVIKDIPASEAKTEDGNSGGVKTVVLVCVCVGIVLFIIAVVLVCVCRHKGWLCFSCIKDVSPGASSNSSFTSIPQQDQGVKKESAIAMTDVITPAYERPDWNHPYPVEELQQYESGAGCAETPLNEAPSLSLDDEEDKIKVPLIASKIPRVEESFLKDESCDEACTTPIRDFEDLKLKEHDELCSMLEYLESRPLKHTLYGYILDNWKDLGFSCKGRVEVCQERKDCRGQLEPVPYFLNHLGAQGVTVHEVLTYFYRQRAKSAKDVLLKFHQCKYCKNKFGSH